MSTADTLTATFETLPLGEPWRAAHDAAAAAIAADRAAAEAQVFPLQLVPVDADTIALYAALVAPLSAGGYENAVLALHGRCVTSHPELARCFRSPECLADVGAARARMAQPTNNRETFRDAEARASADAVARYQRAIAEQIAALPKHELAPAARALLASEDLAARLAAAKARHEEHAAAQLAAAEAERRAAAHLETQRAVERARSAAAAAEDARQKLVLAEHEHRRARADALVARLRASGLKELRVGPQGLLFSVEQVCSTASGMSIASLDSFSDALDAHEARR